MSEGTPNRSISEATSSLEESKFTPPGIKMTPSDLMLDNSELSSSLNTSEQITPQKIIVRAQTTPEALRDILGDNESLTTEDDLRKVNAQLKNYVNSQKDMIISKEEEIRELAKDRVLGC